ncbi:RcnB family protein [Alloalcanivorax mobilis]|uniref:RcnB family protein n=1 Tax=Alloalcanivorax mobilis TaxID=2019569 RepID=UPI0013001124|nr:RcnB family protein [Alloalcanivorax mobilis]|tara:strand:+ start:15710 stop:16060 length:351 start_codon:yes stop_codon:yes gene_type:complete
MNIFKNVALALCLTLTAAPAAWASPGHGGPERNSPHTHHQAGHNSGRHHHADAHRARWHQGDSLPGGYRGNRYVVNDWHAHRLPPPDRHHRWVSVNGDYLLIAIGTGVILSVVAAH